MTRAPSGEKAHCWAENNKHSAMQRKDAYRRSWNTGPTDRQPYLAADDGECLRPQRRPETKRTATPGLSP